MDSTEDESSEEMPPTTKRRYTSTSSEDEVNNKRQRTATETTEDDDETGPETPNAAAAARHSNSFAASDTALRMMKRMGYRENTGLGKAGQGIIEPIQASTQKGRRGLGLKLDSLDVAATKWDESMEELIIPEEVLWLPNQDSEEQLHMLDGDFLWSWLIFGPRKLVIDDETRFIEPELLAKVLSSKSVFDQLGGTDMMRARTRANPFETIRNNIFQNRAAVKMANMDAMFDFMFTNPVDEADKPLIREDDLLYFADVCAGPGGFSEYILFRRGWQAKGFGFTLRQSNDFKLDAFLAGSPETFDPFYGINQNGDIFDPENCESLKDYVLKQTGDGVHLVMADGGFSVAGQENIQEILSKQLYLCQCMVALSLLRTKGHFVVKLFDLFTPFSVGLVYLLYKCFEQVCICKPNTSRPANSERYLVCKWKKPGTEAIEKHLFRINEYLWDHKGVDDNDILELVPMNVLRSDEMFFNYICDSNNRLAHRQIVGLVKIAAFSRDIDLMESRQGEIKRRCLELWKLEDTSRKAPPSISNDAYCSDLMKEWSNDKDFLKHQAWPLKKHSLKQFFLSAYSWYFVPLNFEANRFKRTRTFFMSKGGRNVLAYNADSHNWQYVKEHCIELSPKTLIYGEIVKEFIGEGRSQRGIAALHIIDAIVLGGIDIRRHPLPERIRMCEKFAKALCKPLKSFEEDNTHRMTVPIRCKRLYPLAEFQRFVDSLDNHRLKDGTPKRGIRLRNNFDKEERFYVPEGLLFMNETNDQFIKCLSRTQNTFYYYDKKDNVSIPANNIDPKVVTNSFRQTFVHSFAWIWNEDQSNIEEHQEDANDTQVFRQDIDILIYRMTTSQR